MARATKTAPGGGLLCRGYEDDSGKYIWWPETDGLWKFKEFIHRDDGKAERQPGFGTWVFVAGCSKRVQGRGMVLPVTVEAGQTLKACGKYRSVRQIPRAGAWRYVRAPKTGDPAIPGA